MKLSVCIPSHRPLHAAAGTILKMLQGLPSDVEVIVSDNSLLPDKKAFLEQLAAQYSNLKLIFPETEIPAFENFDTVLKAATGDLVSFCGDDDIMFPQSLTYGREHITQNPEYSCSSGAICNFRPSLGPRMIRSVDYTGQWTDRIRDYLFRVPLGGNFLFYAVYRKELLDRYFAYIAAHPFVYVFFDFHLPIMALSVGNGHIGERGLAVYDNTNWETEAACIASWDTYCKSIGVPTWFAHLQNLYRAVEYLLFIGGEFFDQPKAERLELALEVSNHYFITWMNNMANFIDKLPPNVRRLIADSLRVHAPNIMPPADIVNLFLAILETINPQTALRYKDFFGRNMGL